MIRERTTNFRGLGRSQITSSYFKKGQGGRQTVVNTVSDFRRLRSGFDGLARQGRRLLSDHGAVGIASGHRKACTKTRPLSSIRARFCKNAGA